MYFLQQLHNQEIKGIAFEEDFSKTDYLFIQLYLNHTFFVLEFWASNMWKLLCL